MAGGAVGASLIGTANAATPTPAATAGTSNEDPTHEAGESAAREAAENNGTATYGGHGGGSNEDPAHEAGESAAREAAEDAGTAPAAPSTTTPSGTASPSL
jgi:hypothetical protein